VNRGYAVIDVLKKLQIPYEESKGTEILLKKLDSARISTCIGQSITVDYFIKKLKLTNIVKIKPDVISKDYFLIFSQKFINEHKNIAEKLWSEIGKVRDFEIQKKILTYEN
jgi:polar amino acid transport system substrate-binding protein